MSSASSSGSDNAMKKLLEKNKKLPKWVKGRIQRYYDAIWDGTWNDGVLYLWDFFESLTGQQITDEMIPELLQCIELFGDRVKKLDLQDNHITSKGAIMLLDGLKQMNSKITEIDLSENELDDEFMKSLGEFIQNSNTIEWIRINQNKITDRGIQILSPYLEGNTALKELNLSSYEGITDRSVPYLRSMIEKSKIQTIDIWGTSISELERDKLDSIMESPAKRAESSINEILKQGGGAILRRAKLFTVGDWGQGKTSTIRSLTGQQFIQEYLSTIGANTKDNCKLNMNEVNGEWSLISHANERDYFSSKHQAIALKKEKEQMRDKAKRFREKKVQEHLSSVNEQLSKKEKKKIFMKSLPSSMMSAVTSLWKPKNKLEKKSIENETKVIITEEKEAVISIKGEIVSKLIDDEGLESEITISIWDLGGQKVFYSLHHLFLTDHAVYLLVFDMRQMISEDKKEKSIDKIHFWLKSIRMYASNAKIAFIGTHKDAVSESGQYKMIDEMLLNLFDEKDINKKDIIMNKSDCLFFWPIDNTKGENNRDIDDLRKSIMNAILSQDYLNETVPLNWTSTFDDIIKTNKDHITFDEFREMATRNRLTKDDDQIKMLKKLHELGMLLYFGDENPDLGNIIVINPQWLIDAITKVIRQFDLHEHDKEMIMDINLNYSKEFKKMKDESIVNEKLLYRLWKDEDNGSNNDFRRRRFLLSLMETMSLATKWIYNEYTAQSASTVSANSNSTNVDMPECYLIPSNLRLFDEAKTKERQSEIDKKIPPVDIENISNEDNVRKATNLGIIIIDFSGGYLPIGYYDKLICKIIEYSSINYQGNRKPIIGNGSVLASIGTNDFRIDEDLNKDRIIITIDEKCEEKYVILDRLETILKEMNSQMKKSPIKYRILVGLWSTNERYCFVDVLQARNAAIKNENKIRDSNDDETVLISHYKQEWTSSLNSFANKSISVPRVLKISSNRCELLEQIQTGKDSSIYRIKIFKTGENNNEKIKYAFKKFSISSNLVKEEEIRKIEKEIELLSQLRHDNIVKIIGAIGDPNAVDINNERMGIGIVMEYCQNGSIRSLLDKNNRSNRNELNIDLIIHLLFGAAQGLEYLHNREPNNIMHGDIKSDNILIDSEYNAKICDFGISKLIQTTIASTKGGNVGGTLVYKSPEAFSGKAELKSDVYSFGCVILEMLTGDRPWKELNHDVGQIETKVLVTKSSQGSSKVRNDTPKELIDLMKRCLDYDKDNRPTIKQVKMELEKMMNNAILIKLDNETEEYHEIDKLFFPGGDKEGSLNRDRCKIVKIEKIKHLFAERLYQEELNRIQSMISRSNQGIGASASASSSSLSSFDNEISTNERLLFHGTSQTYPMIILNHPDAFMKDYSNDGFYGRGLYFAELARYSHVGYRYNIPETNQHQMLVCSVICGKSCEFGIHVNDETRQLSQKDLGTEYHSFHGGPYQPGQTDPGDDDSSIYVVYKDTQVCAKYLITYESI